MSQSPDVAVATVLSILVIANIIGNSAVCLIIMKNRDMRIPINYLLVNLAVADIVFATFLAPKFILSHTFTHPNGMTGKVLCRLLTGGTLGWVGGVSSAFTLVAIAIERYYAVMHPLGNKGKLTKRKLKVIIPGSWIFSLVVTFPGFLITNFDKEIDGCGESFPEEWMAKAYSLTWLLSTTALPLALMVGLYSTVAYALWFKRNEDSQLTHQQKSVIKVRKRVTLMVVTVSAIFGISWGTSSVSYVLKHFSSHNIGNVAITNTMAMFNSAVNPFVYALLNQQFREKVKGMMGCSTFLTRKIHPTRKSENYDLTNSINPSTIED
ncbi:QRFP-like peptide receptor [Oculina patagonica]